MKVEEGFGTNLTKFYLIALLYEKPRHGYEIITEIGKNIGKKPSPGQIYPLLKSLRQKGYVKISLSSNRKNYYLTPKGRLFSKSMISHFSGLVKIAIRQNLTRCGNCRCEIYSGTYKSGKNYFCCRNCASAYRK